MLPHIQWHEKQSFEHQRQLLREAEQQRLLTQASLHHAGRVRQLFARVRKCSRCRVGDKRGTYGPFLIAPPQTVRAPFRRIPLSRRPHLLIRESTHFALPCRSGVVSLSPFAL